MSLLKRSRSWTPAIDNEVYTKKAMTWFFRAMILTYCDYRTVFAKDAPRSNVIHDLDHFLITNKISTEVDATYNKIYRRTKSGVVVVDNPNASWNGDTPDIQCYRKEWGSFLVRFKTGRVLLLEQALIQPCYLLSTYTKTYDDVKDFVRQQS